MHKTNGQRQAENLDTKVDDLQRIPTGASQKNQTAQTDCKQTAPAKHRGNSGTI